MNEERDDPAAPRVTVVVPTFGAAQSVRNAVRSLLVQDLPKDRYEVIVVDSSPDDSVARVVAELQAGASCSLRFLRKKAEGPGPSRTLGASEGRGEWIAFMDSDCVASPGWLRAGIAAFADGVGLVQGRTLPDPDVPTGVFTWYVKIENENHIYECANIFYRRSAFQQAGGFSAEYNDAAEHIMGGEDLDLAWRVKRAGWQSRFCAEALVYHEVQPIPIHRWVCHRRLYLWPLLAKRFPELRPYFCCRFFYNRNQALVLLLLAGVILAPLYPATLILTIPYVVSRSIEPTRTLRGPRRLLRAVLYLPQDLANLAILTIGSIRFRSVLL